MNRLQEFDDFDALGEEGSPEPDGNESSELTEAFVNSVVDTVIMRGMTRDAVSEALKNVDSEWILLKEMEMVTNYFLNIQ